MARSISGTARRQFRRPMAFRWLISTGVSSARATLSISARAASTPSPSWRMWTEITTPLRRRGERREMSSSVVS